MKKTFIDVLFELPVDQTMQQFFTDHAVPVPLGFVWADTQDTRRALLECIRQWQDIPAKDKLVAELGACLPLADAQGALSIRAVAASNVMASTGLLGCQGDVHRAFWLYRHHPELFAQALNSDFLDRRVPQAQSHALGIKRHPNTSPAAVAAFSQSISNFYQKKLQCGDGVDSTIFQRSPGVFLVTSHVKGMAMMQLEFQGTNLTRRVGNPSLHSVLEYSERTGAVRTLIRGGADFHRMLASEFATHILGQVVDAKRLMPEKIDLTRMRAGIANLQTAKNKFTYAQLKEYTIESATGQLKLVCTATADAGRKSVTELLKEELPTALEEGWSVLAVQINIYYPGERGRLRSIPVEITSNGRFRIPVRDPELKARVEQMLVEAGVLALGQTLDAEYTDITELPQPLVEK